MARSSSARAGPSNTQQSQRTAQTQRTRGGRRQVEPVSEDEVGEQSEQPEEPDEASGDEMEVDGNSVCVLFFLHSYDLVEMCMM